MFELPKPSGLVLAVIGSLWLASCLTPEERAMVYGTEPEAEAPASVAPVSEPAAVPVPVHAPPKAAPTVPVTVSPNLRPSVGAIARAKPAPGAVDSCRAGEYVRLLDQPLSSLNAMRFSQQVRILMPDTIVTQDFIAKRLNFDIDKQGLIARLWCG
ncbi:hypothetical protein MNBD_ALPHA06-518 [hydrothermal vent metagenome]|uniref:Peptidase inhibitor I78 family protein n=1 Tax=hydrothermal vent metagenome TaxID=652676 RepID=A0A3B0RWP2_9ZZZZ